VVLTDFGIAAIDDATALTATGQMVGSPAYLAPERINGQPATAAADLWALGVTLYTGDRPVPVPARGHPGHLRRDPDQPARPPAHAGRLWPVIKGLLVKDPARRLGAEQAREAAGQRGHDHTVRIWDLIGGRQIGEPLGEPEDGPITTRRVIQSVAVGERDGVPVVVSGGSEHTLRLWDLTTGKQIGQPWSGHTDSVTSVAVGAIDGAPAAVSGGYDLTIRVWNLTTGKQIGEPLTGHTDAVQSVAFGELNGGPVAVSGGQDNTVRIWNLATGQQIGEPLTGHTATIWAVAFGQVDGAPSAVSGGYDRIVRLWDLTSGTQVDALSIVDRQVNSLVLHTLDGGPVCVSASGATLRVWSLAR
jgi:WD40 repeat protein